MKSTLLLLALATILRFSVCDEMCFGYELLQTQLDHLQNQIVQLTEKVDTVLINQNVSRIQSKEIPTGCVKIFSMYSESYLAISTNFGANRRNIFLASHAEEWYITRDADFYRITRKQRREDFYAGMDDMLYDAQRRRVFTWVHGCDDEQGKWEIMEAPGFKGMVNIRSGLFGEYLYAEDFDNNVFTWRAKDDSRSKLQYVWKIEQC